MTTLRESGRTVGGLGSGPRQIYPSENRRLAQEITETGALVSQFWLDSRPTSYSINRYKFEDRKHSAVIFARVLIGFLEREEMRSGPKKRKHHAHSDANGAGSGKKPDAASECPCKSLPREH